MDLRGTAPRSTSGSLAEAIVDLTAIRDNVRAFRQLRPGLSLMAVVKADGFGHGAVPVARAAIEAGATWLGVAHGTEALQLRSAGLTEPILAWLDADPETMTRAGVDISVSSPIELAAAAAVPGVPSVHLKLDTGLHRAGSTIDQWTELTRAAVRHQSAGELVVRAIWSQLSHGEDPSGVQSHRQLQALLAGVAEARRIGLRPDLVHLTNSAGTAILDAPELDLGRIGAGLYGIDEAGIGLRPAMRLVAKIAQVRRIRAGEGVSYGHDYVAPADTTIALIPVGYADGIPRCSYSRASVSHRGLRMPIAGRVAMDQFCIDMGDVPVQPGEEVVIFGPGTESEPTINDWAAWSDTIPHEIYCSLGPRIPRHHTTAPQPPTWW
ncbi:alanine racemase [Kribbella deserti]|uniref:Alanine racemase n=1 Tax=Kribbella deserti TaxID=1926257 RepID=A0ABV6QPZ4_9ACTN